MSFQVSVAKFFGGILINEDGGKESLIALRDVGQIEHGKYKNVTPDFKSMSEDRFRDFEVGNADALR